jgi:DNA-binding NarL/FixJ family response regulator
VIGSISTTIVDPGFFADTQSGSSREAYLTRPLTAREVQVLELVSEGYDNEVVANKFEISLRTVEQNFNEAYGSIKTVALLQ